LKVNIVKFNYIYVIAIFIISIFIIVNYSIEGPVVQIDEGAYLANAAVLAGFKNDLASSYHAGYSLLIAPAFVIGSDPKEIFLIIKIINSLFWGFSFLILFYLISKLFSEVIFEKRLLSCIVALAYPAWMTFSGYALSESGYGITYMLVLFFLYKTHEIGKHNWLLLAVSLGFLYSIHPKAIPVIIASIIVCLLISLYRKDWLWYGFFISLTLLSVFFYRNYFHTFLHNLMDISDSAPRLHYPDPAVLIKANFSIEKLINLFFRFSGHLFYSFVGSVGLILYSLIIIGNNYIISAKRSLHDNISNRKFIMFSLFLLSYLGTLSLSVFFFHGSYLRLDQWMYGRYLEGVILPLLAIGFLFISKKNITITIVITSLLMIFLWIGISEYNYTNPINITAFWQEFYVRDLFPAAWWVLGILPIITTFFIKNLKLKAVVILLFFSFASYHQIKWHKNEYLNAGQRQELASIINDYYLPGSIVGFDNDYGDIPSELIFRYNYGFYLYNYQYKKIDASIWYDNHYGPLISYSKDLDDLFSNTFVIGVENHGGPLLWARSSNQEAFMILNEWYEVAPNSLQTHLFIREGWHDIESESCMVFRGCNNKN
jgi:hypothetical protein